MATNGVLKEPSMATKSETWEHHMKDFCAQLTDLAIHDGFQKVQTVIQENEDLKAEIERLQLQNKTLCRTFGDEQNDWSAREKDYQRQVTEAEKQRSQATDAQAGVQKSLESARKEIKDLRSKVGEREKDVQKIITTIKQNEKKIFEIETLNKKQNKDKEEASKNIKELQANLTAKEKQLQDGSTALAESQKSLDMFRSFLAPMDTIDTKTTQISDGLHHLFQSALSVFQAAFDRDLEVSASGSGNHVALSSTWTLYSPFLQNSNTSAAKQMRVAMSLNICSRALDKHVFRQSYLGTSGELEDVLDRVAKASAKKEVFLRAATQSVLPERHRENHKSAISQAKHEILRDLAMWIPSDQVTTFDAGVTRICEQAGVIWKQVQCIEERIWTVFAAVWPEDWNLLPDWQPKSSTTPPKEKAREGNSGRQASSNEKGMVVWPTFLATDLASIDEADPTTSSLSLPVYTGYLLPPTIIAEADEQVSRRSQRNHTRQNSKPVARDVRRGSTGFLSKGALANSSDAG